MATSQQTTQSPKSVTEKALFHRDLNKNYSVMVRGEGIYLFDEDGNRYIDGCAGAGNVTLGHGRQRIAERFPLSNIMQRYETLWSDLAGGGSA